MKVLGIVLLLAAGGAQAGALAECASVAAAPAEVMACLQTARRQATDRMLDSYLSIEQRLGRQDTEGGRELSRGMLRQSQRDFERYLQAHCQVVQRLLTGAAAVPGAAACEADQLRARAAALDLLGARAN